MLDQTSLVAGIQAADEVPPLGPFRTFQVPVADVEDLTALDLGPLVDADVLAPVGAQGDRERWVPLTALEEMTL